MLTGKEKTKLEELRQKAGLSDEEWEELRELDKKEEKAAKDSGDEGKGE